MTTVTHRTRCRPQARGIHDSTLSHSAQLKRRIALAERRRKKDFDFDSDTYVKIGSEWLARWQIK